MKSAGRRRGFRSWFVEPYLQVKLGLLFLLLNLLFSGLILSIFGYYLWDISQALATYFQMSNEQGTEILEKFKTPVLVGSLLIVVFVGASILLAVRYTHRIYGPLVSIHRFLDELLGNGQVNPLILRESDQLKALAEKLNHFATTGAATRRSSDLTPVYRYVEELVAGKNPEPLRLREHDQYLALADRLNELAEKLRRNRAG